MSNDFEDDDRIRPTRPERGPQRASRPRDDYDEPPPAPRKSSGSKTVLIVLGVVALVGCLCVCTPVGVVGYFGYRGFNQAREKQYVVTNFKQIGLAMHMYHDNYAKFPPVAMRTKSGKPGLSWRVAILPYVDHAALYKEFKTDLPWDHPDNLKLAAKMPAIYEPKRGTGGEKTHVRVFFGPEALYDPRDQGPKNFGLVTDGLFSTIFCVEAEKPALWIQPDEIEFDQSKPLPKLGLPEQDFFIATFCDGRTSLIKKTANELNLKRAITPRAGEVVDTAFP